MCLNYAFENKFLRRIQYLFARILSSSALSKKGYITNSKIKKTLLLISRVLTVGPLKRMLLSFVRINNSNNTSLVGHFFGRAPFPKTTFPVNFLKNPRYIPFESALLPVPKEVEKYLVVRYGCKYMELPSRKEMDKYPSHAHIVDTEKSYKNYIYEEF